MAQKKSTSSIFQRAPNLEGVAITTADQDQKRFVWKNRTQHLFYFLALCINMRTLSSFLLEDGIINPESVPSIIQTILVTIIIGGPLVFLQNFIGQFTQSGCISIGRMLPAMHGFGYCMLLVSLLDATQTLYYSGASLLYLFTSVMNFPVPSWMRCSAEMYRNHPNCFSLEDIDMCKSCNVDPGGPPCFQPGTKVLSAKLFKMIVAFGTNETIHGLANIGLPQWKFIYHIFFTALIIFFVSSRRLRSLDLSLRFSLIFCFLAMLASFVVVFTHSGFWKGTAKFFGLNLPSLLRVKCWMAAYRRVTEALKISGGGQVLLGSYMTMDTPSHFRICHLVGYFLLIVLLFHLHCTLVNSILSCRLNFDDYGIASANDIIFVMYPTEYGLSATPQIWSMLHFSVYWVTSIVSVVMEVVLMDETLSEELKIGDYYTYTRCAIIIVICLLTIPMTSPGGALITSVLGHELKVINIFIIVVTFVIFFLYNFQRLNDDIYFVLNIPPTWYIQACWLITAIVSAVLFIYQFWQYKTGRELYLLRVSLYFIVTSPILICFFIKLVQYVKKRNITGLLRPSATYGAPDLHSRLLRLLYNPRLEVRYRRRKESCKHRCMLNSEAVVIAIRKELMLLENIMLDLHNNEEYKGAYSHIIAQLQEHLRVMTIRFSYISNELKLAKALD